MKPTSSGLRHSVSVPANDRQSLGFFYFGETPMMKLMSEAEISTSLALSATEESPTARTQRIAREARDIEAARVSLRAGRFVEADKVHAWIDSLGTENELPIPVSDN